MFPDSRMENCDTFAKVDRPSGPWFWTILASNRLYRLSVVDG